MTATPEETILINRILKELNFKAFAEFIERLKNGNKIARYSDVDLMSEYKLAYSIFVFDVCPPTPTFKFRYAGTGIRNIIGFEPTSKYIDDIVVASDMEEITSCYRRIVDSETPHCLVQPITFENPDPLQPLAPGKRLMARLVYPLLNDTGAISHLIGLLGSPDYNTYPIKRFVAVPYE